MSDSTQRRFTTVVLGLLSVTLPGAASAQELLSDSLNGGTSGHQDGGNFTGGGWQAPTQIWWDVGQEIVEGGFEVEVTNLDITANSPQFPSDKHHIIAMYQSAHGSGKLVGGDQSSLIQIRTAPGYNERIKVFATADGTNWWENYMNPPHIDPSETHTFRVTWTRGGAVTYFIDGNQMQSTNLSAGVRMRYLFVGRDNTYGQVQQGVIYKNVSVWGVSAPAQPDAGYGGNSFAPVADTFTWNQNSSGNYGGNANLETGSNGRVIFLKFDVTGDGSPVASAQLSLAATNSGGGGNIHFVPDNSWAEGSITANNMPCLSPTVLDGLGAVGSGGVYTFDVTAAIPGNGTYSFAIRSDEPDGSAYSSRESGAGGPVLTITRGARPGVATPAACAAPAQPDAARPDTAQPDTAPPQPQHDAAVGVDTADHSYPQGDAGLTSDSDHDAGLTGGPTPDAGVGLQGDAAPGPGLAGAQAGDEFSVGPEGSACDCRAARADSRSLALVALLAIAAMARRRGRANNVR